jgi:acetylornithine/succinyldiaminopimelate/putrescine aminotransferase
MLDRRWPTYALRNVTLDAFVPDASGRGSMRVRDTDGNVYLDAIGGIGCLPLGHGHPRWIEALHAQMKRLVAAAGPFWTEPQQLLAAELGARTPVRDGRVFFGNTGTEVTEGAIKLATRATGRGMIIAFDNAFHGRTLGSIALTGTKAYRDPYVSTIDEPDDRFARMNVARAPFGDLEAVAALFDRHPGRVAMVCAEPVQGEGGIRPATREFLLGLRELCDRHGTLLGLDEIQSGIGRTGNFAAITTLAGDDAHADIVWFAKALGGGYPVAACVARAELAEHMVKGSHGSTFGGNPLACAAGIATLRIMEEENLFAAAAEQLPTLQRIAAEDPIGVVREVRGCGAMIGIELGDAALAGRVAIRCQGEGLLATVSGGTAIRWLLPYRAGRDELGEAWTALRAAVAKASATA